MIGVRLSKSGTDTSFVPWVRVLRHKPYDSDHKYDRTQTLGIDVVHLAYLDEYLEKQLLPFANLFASKTLKHHQVLADSRGFVSGMGKNCWSNIEPRLQPITIGYRRKRATSLLKNVFDKIRDLF